MPRHLAVLMDPIADIKPAKDTSLALLLAAQARGWQLSYLEQGDIFLRDGKVYGAAKPLQVHAQGANWFQLGAAQTLALTEFDALLMRKDPPFDMEYVYSTQLLEIAASQGLAVVNNARSIRDCNEKLFAAWFPQCCTATLVTRAKARIKAFLAEHGRIVLKPLDGMGGTGVFRIDAGDPNTSAIIETLTELETRMVMAQRYLPEIATGDKRILMLFGQPIDHCLARIPAAGEARGNLAAGGTGAVRELSERDRWLCAQIGPELTRRGLHFVGIDVIGDYVTEINVTSPTCLQEIRAVTGIDYAAQFIEGLEQHLDTGRNPP